MFGKPDSKLSTVFFVKEIRPTELILKHRLPDEISFTAYDKKKKKKKRCVFSVGACILKVLAPSAIIHTKLMKQEATKQH